MYTRPRDIIVKFVSYRSKASVLTKMPMEKLMADNGNQPPHQRIYVREDLTKARATILYKTRHMKKNKLIKDTFSRDGRIVIKPAMSDRIVYVTNDDEFNKFCKKA